MILPLPEQKYCFEELLGNFTFCVKFCHFAYSETIKPKVHVSFPPLYFFQDLFKFGLFMLDIHATDLVTVAKH